VKEMKEILTPELIIDGKYSSVEKSNSDVIQKLGWGEHTDVLYSFCNIIALGLYIQEKNKYEIGNDKRIRLRGNRKWLATHKNLQELKLFNDKAIKVLIDSHIIKEFAQLYNTIGNIIPIWPGGNEFKGRCFINGAYCYDIPDIFFYEYYEMEKVYLKNILKIEITDAALSRFGVNADTNLSNKTKSIFEIFEYKSLDDYLAFVNNIVNEINTRNDELKKIMKNITNSK
jgi:hypothetical protein